MRSWANGIRRSVGAKSVPPQYTIKELAERVGVSAGHLRGKLNASKDKPQQAHPRTGLALSAGGHSYVRYGLKVFMEWWERHK